MWRLQPTNGKNDYIHISWNCSNREKHLPSELSPFIPTKEYIYDVIICTKHDGAIRFALPCFILNLTDMRAFALLTQKHLRIFAVHTIFCFGYGLFCLGTWAFFTFILVYRHLCSSQKAQIPKSHMIVTIMLIWHLCIRDYTVLTHNKYIWRFINCFWHDFPPFLRLLWMCTRYHVADPLFQHRWVAPDQSHTDCVTLEGKR